MTYLLKFGSYTFPAGFKPSSVTSQYDVATQEHPRAAGAITQAGRKSAIQLVIDGSEMGDGGGVSAIQSAIDTLRATVELSQPQKLYFGRDDRYIWAQCTKVPESYASSAQGSSMFGGAHDFTLEFLAGWPYFIDTAGVQTATLTGTGGTVTPGGNAPTYATWNLTVGTGGTGIITLTNTTTGEVAQLEGVFSAGDVIELQRGVVIPSASGGVGIVYQVLYNSVATPSLMLGRIPMLAPGSNTITVSLTDSMTLSGLTAQYTAQWNS